MTHGRWLTLGVIGTAGGVFSGLFGVGGGSVIVPLLVLWLGYGTREATGTSLAAIVVIAAIAAAVQAGYGNVRVREGIVIGVLAAGGAFGGVALANVLPERTLEIAFAGLMVIVALQLARDALREKPEAE